MLTGKELGQAIAEAIRLKRVTKTAVAQHFGVKGPSVYDWINHGRIGKQHLAELVAYFSDVVGPEHWGMAAGSIEDDIAPSFARLLTAANIDSRVPMTQSAIARALGVSPGTVVAWRGAGVSQDGAEFAQAKFGVPASWILFGTGVQLRETAPSQPARLDPDVLRIAAQTARAIAARAIDPEQDADLLAKAYDAIVELAGSQPPPAVIVDLLDWYRGRGGASGLSGEGATGGAGPAAGGKPARKASA